MKTRAILLVSLTALALGCSSNQQDAGEAEACGSQGPAWSAPKGAKVHGVRADCSVDITASEAWPGRRQEPPPLTADEHARACAALSACIPLGDDTDEERRGLLALCAQLDLGFFWEERAVPTSNKNERWAFEARAAIAAAGDCDAINAAGTPRPDAITCEEGGCYSSWKQVKVTCAGDMATIVGDGVTYARDCARAYQTCDAASPTGCTDRLPTACLHPARARCEGDIKLGCDSVGRVSFHDCARVPGGRCAEGPEGGRCVYPDAGACDKSLEPSCDGDIVVICQGGEKHAVDCKALGFDGCRAGRCFHG